MPRDDYEAISRIIEEVVGSDTLTGVKLLEGIKFYFDNKEESSEVVTISPAAKFKIASISEHKDEADKAMKRYTAKLKEENLQYR